MSSILDLNQTIPTLGIALSLCAAGTITALSIFETSQLQASLPKIIQTISISISLSAGGGIAALSIFAIPQLQSQPADRSLPLIRWLFSRGGHIFPQAATIAMAGFTYLAYDTLPEPTTRSISQLLKTTNGFKVNAYLTAAVLAMGIAPFTILLMIPNNFAIIKKNEMLGGARSVNAAKVLKESGYKPGQRSAVDSINSLGEGSELFDLSGPQTKTPISSSEADDREVRRMLGEFGRYNLGRALLVGGAGVVGLVAALS
ncbi:uncharacterized protein RCC_09425 [Ramularia collo-cygni]|uniref:Uncharacterized protein n=1 Tax=Ramularia collo-cygni TaxID=112498 RepID=A0A2D3VHK4_9PEZI|nr:uncharacterized protein RCC_09425 [Ramularia collo-cygni]CZT23711.1 uncharacterized protein RCC_09425 [Ramularia collo-cygni]